MAVHPPTTSRIGVFIEAMVKWAEPPWATTVNIPFIIAGCTNRSVIFDLQFQMELTDGDPIFMTNPAVGWMFQWEGVECTIAL